MAKAKLHKTVREAIAVLDSLLPREVQPPDEPPPTRTPGAAAMPVPRQILEIIGKRKHRALG